MMRTSLTKVLSSFYNQRGIIEKCTFYPDCRRLPQIRSYFSFAISQSNASLSEIPVRRAILKVLSKINGNKASRVSHQNLKNETKRCFKFFSLYLYLVFLSADSNQRRSKYQCFSALLLSWSFLKKALFSLQAFLGYQAL